MKALKCTFCKRKVLEGTFDEYCEYRYKCQNWGPLTCVLWPAVPPAWRAPAPGSVMVCCLLAVNFSLSAPRVQAWAPPPPLLLTSSEDRIISRLGLCRILCYVLVTASYNVIVFSSLGSPYNVWSNSSVSVGLNSALAVGSAPRSLHLLLLSDEKITRPPPRHRAVSIPGRGKLRTRGRGSRVILYQSYFFEAIRLLKPPCII